MKKLFAALILTACASMLNAATSYDGSLKPITPPNPYSSNYGSGYSGSSSYNPNFNPSQAPNYNFNPTNYGSGDYYGNYGQSSYANPSGGRRFSGSEYNCPSGRCTQGCNPRTGRSNMPLQGPYQQGPQGAYQGQYQPYPQAPFQRGQYSQYSDQAQFPGSSHYGPGAPQGQMQGNDQQLTKEVQDSLRGMFTSKYNNVYATVNNGYVTLQGTVASQEDRNDLEQKVRKMDGIRGINNQVVILPGQNDAQGQGYSYYNQRQNPVQNPNQGSSSYFQGKQGERFQGNSSEHYGNNGSEHYGNNGSEHYGNNGSEHYGNNGSERNDNNGDD